MATFAADFALCSDLEDAYHGSVFKFLEKESQHDVGIWKNRMKENLANTRLGTWTDQILAPKS